MIYGDKWISPIGFKLINIDSFNSIPLDVYRSCVTFGSANPETPTVKKFGGLPLYHEFLSVSKPPNSLQPWLSAIRFDISFPRATIER